jgi:DNA-binding NarL/FixJ family response regulator
MLRTASSQGKPSGPTAAVSSANGHRGEGWPSTSRILIVEDDFFVATALENDLQEAGYEVVGTAVTAEEAIKMAGERAPTLAIMDIRLAGSKDGIEAAIAILSLYRVPSIFATAHGDVETRRRAEKASPLGWVNKPYSHEIVLAAIRSALAR